MLLLTVGGERRLGIVSNMIEKRRTMRINGSERSGDGLNWLTE